MRPVNIALVGDYSRDVTAHLAIPRALAIAAAKADCQLDYQWVDTASIGADCDVQFSSFEGLWCVPASPYKNKAGALAAIRYAREHNKPFLGTCGGYQHAVLEYARNALGHGEADNLEDNPDTDFPLIAPMVCPLREVAADIKLVEGTRIADYYGATEIREKYNCGFGVNRDYLSLFEGSDMNISAFDSEGDPRAIEIDKHPFFVGVAFQPERSALQEKDHPLVTAFVTSMKAIVT